MNTRTLLLAGASAIVIAATARPAAAAPTELFGGGGTLAAKVYRDIFNCYSKYNASVPTSNDGIYANATISPGNPANVVYPTGPNASCTQQSNNVIVGYEPVGSGAGLSAYTALNPANWGSPSSSNPIAYLNSTYTDYSATPYPQIQFAGSDAYLSAAQAQAASTADGNSSNDHNAFTVPTVATPITLPLTGSTTYDLTTADICNVFSGSTNTLSSGTTLSEVVVRSDGSGTSFIFSDWLAQNCPAGLGFNAGNGFPGTAPNWSAVFAANGNALPIVAKSGSGGVANEIATPTNGGTAIGYVSPDYVQPHASVNATPATIGGISPVVTAANVGCTSLGGTCATLDEVAVRIAAIVTTQPFYDSATIGQTLNDTLTSTTAGGYPIVGFTFIDTYKCYSTTIANTGTVAQGKALKTALQNNFLRNTYTDYESLILGGQGFDPILSSSNVGKALLANSAAKGYGPFGAHGIQGTAVGSDPACPAS